jgi:PAS domain S-box-containing protein
LGPRFVDEVRAHARDDFGAVVLTGSRAGELLTAEAFVRLRPSSQLAVPIVERGRTVAVFVAERDDSERGWSDAEVVFAERVVARAAAALAGVERLESLAQQVGHAREEQEQMEGAMRQLQAVVTALPDALVGVDAEGRITFANRAAGRLLGVAEFDLIGRWLAEVASELGGAAETWERVLAASSTERHTASLRRGAGTATVHVTVVPAPAPGVFDRLISLSDAGSVERGARSKNSEAPSG